MRVEITARCLATLTETWRAEVPDGLEGDDLRDAAHHAFQHTGEFIREESSDEHDREVVDVEVIEQPERKMFTVLASYVDHDGGPYATSVYAVDPDEAIKLAQQTAIADNDTNHDPKDEPGAFELRDFHVVAGVVEVIA